MGVFERAPPASRIDLAEEQGFSLGAMKVVPSECAVAVGNERQPLQPRVMKVLVALAKASPAVVSRDRLVDQCWDGRIVGDDALNRCVLALRHLAQDLEPPPFTIETVPKVGHRLVEAGSASGAAAANPVSKPIKLLLAIALVIMVTVAALLFARPWNAGPRPLTVVVSPGLTDPLSRKLADDLAVKLGGFEAARPTFLKLIMGSDGLSQDADLLLEVARTSDRSAMRANLALKSNSDRSILWSKELGQPSGKLADLKQQMAFMAARVLECAAETSNANGERLNHRSLQLYLNGCAALADLHGREAERVIPIFREVLRITPRFEGAWAKLLLADSEVYLGTAAVYARDRLNADLAAARKINPNLPEGNLAQIALLPVREIAAKMRLVDRAIEIEPDNAGAYMIRSQLLQLIGRMRDSIIDARHAVQLDPLSPVARSQHAYALAAAGRYDAARLELQAAEHLWPGSSNVAEAQFAINLRFGDAKQALDFLRANPSADWMNAQSYLEARSNRSPAKIERAILDAESLYRSRPSSLQHLIQVYGEFDRNEQLFDILENAPTEAVVGLVDLTFRAPTIDFWLDQRSLRIAERAGLLDYWQSSGQWPDFCFRPDLPYDCEAEAAKLTH